MIIVSQDKNRIINFDNITRIEYEKCNGENYIVYDLTNGCYGSLGTYETKERAKEVLEEIVKLYEQKDLPNGDISYKNVNYPKVYRMPEV